MLHLSTTCPDIGTAKSIARAALLDRLCACANILPGVVSVFHWQGAVEEEAEVLLVFKTTEARRQGLIALIERLHPYDLPVITWEEVGTTGAAAEWVAAETSDPDAGASGV